jgi:hypothetical protein
LVQLRSSGAEIPAQRLGQRRKAVDGRQARQVEPAHPGRLAQQGEQLALLRGKLGGRAAANGIIDAQRQHRHIPRRVERPLAQMGQQVGSGRAGARNQPPVNLPFLR